MARQSNTLIWWLAAGLVLLGGGAAVYTATRGLRNNNPGNIALTSPPTPWVGAVTPNTDGTFVQFTTPEFGIRAIAVLLTNYFAEGYQSVQDIISRYSSTDQASYIANVSNALGVNPTDVLDLSNPSDGNSQLPDLISAIITQENGINPYSDATIANGISAALTS